MLLQSLTNITALKAALYQQGITPSRAMGQNFLLCDEIIEATLSILKTQPKNVTELGAGAGTLTQALAAAGFSVHAIEKDDGLARIIPRSIPASLRENVTVVHDDLRNARWSWDIPYSIVGNIPYNLSGLVIRHLVQTDPAPELAIFLVQKEVGERMTSSPPYMNLLSLSVQLWGSVHHLLSVPPNCFWPQPKVSSWLLLLTPHKDTLPDVQSREQVLRIAKTFFQKKRKQIGGTLKREYTADPAVLSPLSISPAARPQELTVEQWIGLTQTIKKLRN